MKIKTLTAMLANCFLLSNLAVANETIAPKVSVQEKNPCQEKSFWETNFPKGQFTGFYSQMTNDVISTAQFQFANQYFDGSIFKKDLSRALDLYQRAHARGIIKHPQNWDSCIAMGYRLIKIIKKHLLIINRWQTIILKPNLI
jgi:hypothetical protein